MTADRFPPKYLIDMARWKNLPDLLISKWVEQGNENPVSVAYTAVTSFWVRVVLATLVTIPVGVFGWFFFFNTEETVRSLGGEASIVAGLVGFTVALILWLSVSSKSSKFSDWKDGFGKNFSELAGLLEKKPGEIPALELSSLEEAVWDGLVQRAMNVLRAERKLQSCQRNFNEEVNYSVEWRHKEARHLFKLPFETVRRFGLAKSEGWKPYFDEAERRLTLEEEGGQIVA